MSRSKILIAHNIRSLWNVGSLFRTADCFGVKKIYLTGYTATPPRREISKTALGAEQWIEWEYEKDPKKLIRKLQKDRIQVIALEITDAALDISSFKPPENMALLLGHEVLGVSEELLQMCDAQIYIPLYGKKESLNVSVAAGIALERLTHLS